MPNLWIQPSVWTSVTAPSVFPLSSKFTLEYLLWDDSLDSESVSPCSGSMLSSVRSGRWGASLPGPSAAAVLFSLAPTARTLCVQWCMCRVCRHWGARSFRSGPAATSLCPAPPHRQHPLRAVHWLSMALHLRTSLCMPTCWPHAWGAFLSSGLLPSTLSPGLDACSTRPWTCPAAPCPRVGPLPGHFLHHLTPAACRLLQPCAS